MFAGHDVTEKKLKTQTTKAKHTCEKNNTMMTLMLYLLFMCETTLQTRNPT